jgi:hypothetical protein
MRTLFWAAAALLLTGCYQVGSLPGTSRTDHGRRPQVRGAPRPDGNGPNEWRMEINRATMVIRPDDELEAERAYTVAKRIMTRTCKGRPYNQAIEGMQGINYRTVFTCE